MKKWHATRRWRKLDSLRTFWWRITLRPKLALNVLFRYQDISILHNHNVIGGRITPKVGKQAYVTNCYIEQAELP